MPESTALPTEPQPLPKRTTLIMFLVLTADEVKFPTEAAERKHRSNNRLKKDNSDEDDRRSTTTNQPSSNTRRRYLKTRAVVCGRGNASSCPSFASVSFRSCGAATATAASATAAASATNTIHARWICTTSFGGTRTGIRTRAIYAGSWGIRRRRVVMGR